MSVDYSSLFKGIDCPITKFKKWVKFWDLGVIEESNQEIADAYKQSLSEYENKKIVRHRLIPMMERLDDLKALSEKHEDIEEGLFQTHILKIEREWSNFKLATIVDDDTLYSRTLKTLGRNNAKAKDL